MATRSGKPETFTHEQQEALRLGLREWIAEQERLGLNFTQAGLGELLGVSQQTAGRFLRIPGAGVNYRTATRIAQVLSFAGVDAFFADRGVGVSSVPRAPGSAPRALMPAPAQRSTSVAKYRDIGAQMDELIAEMRRMAEEQGRVLERLSAVEDTAREAMRRSTTESGTVRTRRSSRPPRSRKASR